jgi:hypothetical protein
VIFQFIASSFFTGIFTVSFPKWIDTLGSALLGFVCGYVLWGFLCFTVLIMPLSQKRFLLNALTGDKESVAISRRSSTPSVSKIINTANAISFQSDTEKVHRVICWTLGWANETPSPTESDPNETPELSEPAGIQG